MKLIVGLGNPGQEYKNTRHNVGFMVIDKLADNFKLNKKFTAAITRKNNIIYAKPLTFMNESGSAVKKIAQYYKIKPQDILIIHDDKDLPLGKIRIKKDGSAGGHNGIKSIIAHLGSENFNRLRIGINNPNIKIKNTADYVLNNFSSSDNKKIKAILSLAQEAVLTIQNEDIEKAMNIYNARNVADK
jgi:PTH1 family peptidyl-tRNA hydrolase